MRARALTVVAVAALACLAAVEAAPKSRFRREIDLEKLGEEWKDGEHEDEDWHEDTYEWTKKARAKRKVKFDASNPQEFLAQSMASQDGLQMLYVSLKKDKKRRKNDVKRLAGQWQALLKTNGVEISAYPVGKDQIMFTQLDGRVLETKDFMLSRPEVASFRWKEKDYYPEGESPEELRRKERRSKKKKGGKKKKKDGNKKKAAAGGGKGKKKTAAGKKAAEPQAPPAAGRDEL